jgi:hypothetical protein
LRNQRRNYLTIKLTRDIKAVGGRVFEAGGVREAYSDIYGQIRMEGMAYRYLRPDEWEPHINEREMNRLLGEG